MLGETMPNTQKQNRNLKLENTSHLKLMMKGKAIDREEGVNEISKTASPWVVKQDKNPVIKAQA